MRVFPVLSKNIWKWFNRYADKANELYRHTGKHDDNKGERSLFRLNMCVSVCEGIEGSAVRAMSMAAFYLHAYEKVESFLRSIGESLCVPR